MSTSPDDQNNKNHNTSRPKQYDYSPDTSRRLMAMGSRKDFERNPSSETIRYVRRTDPTTAQHTTRPAPPPYNGQIIPRVKAIQKRQAESNTTATGLEQHQQQRGSRPNSRRFDTFGENALETIYDQFKFLDESDEPPSAQTPTSINSTRPIMPVPSKKRKEIRSTMMISYCVLPTLELLAAVAISSTSFLRGYGPNYHRKEDHETTNEDGNLAYEAISNLSFQNAMSTIVPSIFQIISALFGYWPLFSSKHRKAAQVLHIIFNSIVIILWFNAIYDLFFKISMEHLLQPNLGINSDEKYVIDLIVACIIYFATVLLPAITISVAAFNLITPYIRSINKSMSSITISLGTLLFSLATTVIAIFTAQANLNAPKDLSDNSSLYAYGLKESIVFIFVVITSIFSLIVSSQNNKPLMMGAIIGQIICLMSVTVHLFTSERISAIFNELKMFSNSSGSTAEIGIVLLNGCAIASCALLVIQISIFIFSFSSQFSSSGFSSLSSHSLLIDNNRNPNQISTSQRLERTAF